MTACGCERACVMLGNPSDGYTHVAFPTMDDAFLAMDGEPDCWIVTLHDPATCSDIVGRFTRYAEGK